MHLPEGLTVEAMVASVLPWAAPCLTAQRGHALDGEPTLVLGYEWSAPWVHTMEQISKQHREFLHAQRFAADYLATGVPPFWNLTEGADPPDWVAENQDGLLGVECAQLTVQERRTAQALFLGLRQKLLLRLGGPLPYLMNHVVYFWFDGHGGLELPLKRGDEDAIADLAQALLAHRPDPARLWHEGGLPEHLPTPDLVRTPAGAVFHCAPMANAVPTTPLYTATGIEVGFVYTTLHRRSDAWARVQKLVDDHDQEGVDWLVLSAGAPNQHGTRFLSLDPPVHSRWSLR